MKIGVKFHLAVMKFYATFLLNRLPKFFKPMNRIPQFALGGLVSSLISTASAALVPIPDGDFETGQSGWAEVNGDGTFTYDYPATGGNPDGHGIIDNTGGGGWGIWVSNFENPILLADLGLNAGEIYTFSQDMKVFSGSNVGGFKVDFFNGTNGNGSTGDIFPAMIGDGTTWETYSFDISIPAGTDGVKIVPLWGADSRVGYDNIQVDDTPLAPPTEIPDADFEAADGVAWEEGSGGGTFAFTFPGDGGNPGGHAVIDNSAGDGGWAVLVSDNGQILPLSGLGLTSGNAYIFSLDMKIISGSNIGGFKVDFFNGGNANGSTGDLFPTAINGGANWETYDFQINIPESATGVKLVPLWGSGSVVGYDNLTFDPTPINVPDITEIPNGDFEDGNTSWSEAGAPNTTFSYSDSDGNPGGHGVMTNDGEGFGVWISNGGGVIPIDGLGLAAGETYRFSQDMKILSGGEIGGLKVEFYKGTISRGDTGDMRPALLGDGATWETYTFEVPIPLDVDGIKLVPLWGPGSSVAYDNFSFSTDIIPSPPILNADFENGGANWSDFAGGETVFEFPETGGNPGGYAQMKNTSMWAVLVSNSSNITPISKFGITEEGEYQFQMDMKIFDGFTLGGLKVEFYTDGAATGGTGDMFPALIGDGSTWETYTFDVFIPAGINGLKIVPLWGEGSTVGFDNIVTPGGIASGFAGWIQGFPDVGELTGFNDDPDKDGQTNGLENFLGTDPSKNSQGLIVGSFDTQSQTLVFTHSQNPEPTPEASNASYTWSTDLKNFYEDDTENPDGTIVSFNILPDTPSAGTTTVRAEVAGPIPPRIFVRLAVSGEAP